MNLHFSIQNDTLVERIAELATKMHNTRSELDHLVEMGLGTDERLSRTIESVAEYCGGNRDGILQVQDAIEERAFQSDLEPQR